jgi:peptidoglycan lytic transglycosylase
VQRGFSTLITRLVRFLPRRSIPLIAAGTIALVVVVAAAAAMTMGPATDTPVAAHVAATSASPGPVASRTTDGDRASRSELRVDPGPLPSPSSAGPSSPAAPSKKATSAASQPSGGGTVTSTSDCEASYYGTGTTNADGEPFDPNAYTAAHKTLPFHTRVRVTNKANGKSVVVEIKDRGPYVAGRCIDLTTAAFRAIASLSAGVASVHLEILG